MSSFAENCPNEKDSMGFNWINGAIRKQAAGYVFYRSQSSSNRKFIAELKSDGVALERVQTSCGKIPVSTRIVEKCVDFELDGFKSYSRASFKELDCKGKSENSGLKKRYLEYKKYIENSITKECSKKHPNLCLDDYELELDLGNLKEALKIAIKGCNYRVGSLCLSASMTYMKLKEEKFIGESEFTKKYVALGCEEYKDPVSCLVYLKAFGNKFTKSKVIETIDFLKSVREENEFIDLWLATSLKHKSMKDIEKVGRKCNEGYLFLCESYLFNLAKSNEVGKKVKVKSMSWFKRLCFLEDIKSFSVPKALGEIKKDKNRDIYAQTKICDLAAFKANKVAQKVEFVDRVCKLRASLFSCYYNRYLLLKKACDLKSKDSRKVSSALASCNYYKGLGVSTRKWYSPVLKYLEYIDIYDGENFPIKKEKELKKMFGIE